MSALEFHGGAAFVTGGSGGIGGAIVETFAREGSDVIFTYRSGAARAEEVKSRAAAYGVKAEALPLQLEDPAELDAVLTELAQRNQKIHSFVYASGPRVKVGFVSDLADEDWKFTLQHDVIACFNLVKAAIAFFRKYPASETEAGCITTITSSQKFRPESRGVLSAAPKAAIEALTFATAKENARFKIRANVLQSGWVAAGQIADGIDGQLNEEAMKSIVAQIPVRRLGRPSEVAEGAVFLSSRRASFITGATLVVDGGMHL